MPTALADTPENANSKAYAIRIQGEAVPAAVHDISYPARAATRSRDGHCDLLVQMDANGNIGGVAVSSCSDATFRQEADRLVKNTGMVEGQSDLKPLRIEWDID